MKLENTILPDTFFNKEIECDKHNIQMAITLMNDKQSKASLKRLEKFCRDTKKHIRYSMSHKW